MIAADLADLVVGIDRLDPLPGNPRRGDVDAVARSYAVFGQRKPIVARRVGDRGVVIAGNHQLAAARQLGWSEIAVVWTDDDEETAAAFALADNRTADLGGYDDGALAAMLSSVEDAELLAATGWSEDAIAELLAGMEPQVLPLADPDVVPDVPVDPRTRPGDVWLLGPHRVLCGDCRDFADVERLLGGARVDVAFTSPPYASQRAYDESSGFRPIRPGEYVGWFRDVQANVRAVLADEGSWFVNIKAHAAEGQRDLYVHDLVVAHVRDWGWAFVDDLCWVDTRNGVPGRWPNRFKDAWEPVFHFSAGGAIKFRPLANGTDSDGVFDYSRDNAKASSGSGLLGSEKDGGYRDGVALPSNVLHIPAGGTGEHSAQFPVDLPAWFIRAYSDPGDHVFDPFLGSGTTLIAAHQEGRAAFGTEISPAYVDVICRRFQEVAGDKPVLEATGEPRDFTGE